MAKRKAKKKATAKGRRRDKTDTASVQRARHEAPRYKIEHVWRGAFLRELRNMRDFSRWELADEMCEARFGNTTPEMILEWENGLVGPDLNESAALARILGVTLAGIFAWDRVAEWVTPKPAAGGPIRIWSSVRLRELRGDLSLEDLARKASDVGWDVTTAELRAFETGQEPDYGEGVMLCRALGVTADELLVGTA